ALTDNDRRVRMTVATALGSLVPAWDRERRAVGPLIVALKDEDEAVRSRVAAALRYIGGPEAERALAEYGAPG
ncbi:MAG TPA: HEAT repeat domain-containing protein, partial [Candidatus Limnocylindria bacterium]